ncbi:GP41 [Lonomia obliqua multiple nucleopolyhedrovirus]|uniref:GP41 n=1 Tax=Lonomia obliqua multiple nucleopolyhedrovirus TaxID=134394 RepID=A0A126FC56_9ABAC|nr:GP41 [Lonomia obliqua multiple nucleopolyhedrovirus]AKN80978.1 GP41 [Lonomia obliqua multiple nucleopolyhedrovirus]
MADERGNFYYNNNNNTTNYNNMNPLKYSTAAFSSTLQTTAPTTMMAPALASTTAAALNANYTSATAPTSSVFASAVAPHINSSGPLRVTPTAAAAMVTDNNKMDYTSRSNSNNSLMTLPNSYGDVSNADSIWYNKCVDLVHKIIKYYRSNDMSELSPLMIHFINTIRDMCIETNPVHVNVVKRFDTEENIIRHYMRLQKELSQNNAAELLSSETNIFQPSFVLNSLPAYAQKFYNNGSDSLAKNSLNEAAKQLSVAVQYMVAESVANNVPIPLPFNQQLANNYITLLLKHATLPTNVQNAVESRRFPHINMINDLINNVIDDIFAGGGDYYHYLLNEKNRARVISLKENIGFLAPLSASADIFSFIAEMATRAGKRPSMFQNATFLTTAANAINSPSAHTSKSACQESLTELAFQNEALRRFIFQQINYKQNQNQSFAKIQ